MLRSSFCGACAVALGILAVAFPFRGDASSLVTVSVPAVQAFQTGSIVLGFDEVPGNAGGSTPGAAGTPVQLQSRVTQRYRDQGVLFSSSAGPIGVVSVQGLSNQSDAHSPYNLIGGTESIDTIPRLSWYAPITLQFLDPLTGLPAVTDRVGAWNDPTGSIILLSAYDIGGNLIESVQASQGFFLGLQDPGIASATFSWVSNQATQGFSLDDVTFGFVPGASTDVGDGQRVPAQSMRAAPNPSPSGTTLQMTLERDAFITLAVYDVRGRRVRMLEQGVERAGELARVWDGRDDSGRAAGAGVYFARLDAGGRVVSRRVIRMR